MTTNHHTPITTGAARNAATINAPLSSLDTKISSLDTDIVLLQLKTNVNSGLLNGKLSVTVVSNDLVLAIKTLAGADPSASTPVYIVINGTLRTITAATSCTLADGTNWFNAGGSELATKEVDYFAYAIWDSNSSVVAVAPARIPYGRLVSDFSATTTNEKHIGNYANYTSTDDVCVIGRFAATLSAGAGYTWTVPTFTSANLVQQPIFETRRLTYAPQGTGFSGTPTVTAARYQVDGQRCRVDIDNFSGTSNGTGFTITAPFANGSTCTYQGVAGLLVDNSASLTVPGRVDMQAGTAVIILYKDMNVGTWTNSGTKGAYFNLTFFLL